MGPGGALGRPSNWDTDLDQNLMTLIRELINAARAVTARLVAANEDPCRAAKALNDLAKVAETLAQLDRVQAAIANEKEEPALVASAPPASLGDPFKVLRLPGQ